MTKNIKKEGTENITQDIKINKLDKSRVEIIGAIKSSSFDSFRSKAIQNINNEISIDGFRKGKVPESTLIAKVGEAMILEEMAEIALSHAYPEIIINEKIDAIRRPEIQITKIASGNPLEFKITTTVMPEIELVDYKKISKELSNTKEENFDISEKELEDAILRIRKSRVDHSHHDHGKMSDEEHEKEIEKELPELNDAFVTSLGDFKDVNDFKEKIRLSLIEDKKYQAKEKRRIALSDKLIENTKIDLPEIMVNSELRRIEAQFTDDIARMGVKLEDYLKHAKKTIEEIRKEWIPHAEKKAKLQLILNKISETENIVVDKKDIEEEVKHIMDHYKDANPEQAYTYAETVLTNEKVYLFLENNK